MKMRALSLFVIRCCLLSQGALCLAAHPAVDSTFTMEELKLPGKKGACFTLRAPGARAGGTAEENLPKVKALNVSWNYSWGPTLVKEQPSEVEFVPMIWGAGREDRFHDQINTVQAYVDAGKVKRILAFNEPDKKEQSNMPYMRAIELWPAFEALGIPLASPACANPEGVNDPSTQGVPGTWIRDFMREADKRGYRVDYIAAHWYGGTNAEAFKAKMRRIYEKYGKRPLLITEFAPADWKTGGDIKQHRHTPAKVLAFMKEVLPWIEAQDWILGYAWFSFDIDSPQGTSSALFDQEDNLTACGRYYRSIGPDNPEGDQTIQPDSKVFALSATP